MVISGEPSGISGIVNWRGGGTFSFYDYGSSKMPSESTVSKESSAEKTVSEPTLNGVIHYHQLDLFEVSKKYPVHIVKNQIDENDYLEDDSDNPPMSYVVKKSKNVLVSLVKPDNIEQYLDQSAKIYYTGKRFPSSVALNKLYYFMPYIKRKGVKDLYLIKIARVGTRKEGQPDNDPNDFRLVFEIEFIKELFDDYMPIELEIWHTFTDTTMEALLAK